jgi:hypothetical protein
MDTANHNDFHHFSSLAPNIAISWLMRRLRGEPQASGSLGKIHFPTTKHSAAGA